MRLLAALMARAAAVRMRTLASTTSCEAHHHTERPTAQALGRGLPSLFCFNSPHHLFAVI
jgi:hypothetical protein